MMKKFTVLIVEDDSLLSQSVVDFLDCAKYDVIAVDDAALALEYAREQGLPSIALIAFQLPSMSGFEVARRLKSRADLPIIFLLSTDDTDLIIDGLQRYADDFVVKPFALGELEARMQMALGTVPVFDHGSEPVIVVDDYLSIDFAHSRILAAGKAVGLTPTESVLLHVLLRNAPRVVQNGALLARVWAAEDVFEDRLRVHMHRLRRKIEIDAHHPHYIRTERGVGYRFTQRPSGPQEHDI